MAKSPKTKLKDPEAAAEESAEAKAPAKMLLGILDDTKRLVGYRQTGPRQKARANEIELPDGCDLPDDGSYFWDGERFVPVGHGLGKPKPAPHDREYVFLLVLRALIAGTPIPQEAVDYLAWADKNIMPVLLKEADDRKKKDS